MEVEWWEIEGKGRWPEEGQEEFIRGQIRKGEGWAIAYGLLKIAEAIRGGKGVRTDGMMKEGVR
jgi:hypothetical protein